MDRLLVLDPHSTTLLRTHWYRPLYVPIQWTSMSHESGRPQQDRIRVYTVKVKYYLRHQDGLGPFLPDYFVSSIDCQGLRTRKPRENQVETK